MEKVLVGKNIDKRLYKDVRTINWFAAKLNQFYGDNNNGFIYGIEVQTLNSDYECTWFRNQKERDQHFKLYCRGII